MKKLVILGTALLALNAVASEFQVKGGYDFYRKYKSGADYWKNSDFKVKNGATAGVEYIVDNQGEFEWGLGAEYKFANNSGKLKPKKDQWNGTYAKAKKIGRDVPVYALGKFNLITTNNGNDALYVLGRAGYNFAKESKEARKQAGLDIKGGLYTAAGIGTEFGPVSLEALYERSSFKVSDKTKNVDVTKYRDHLDTVGVKVGYRIGQLKNDRSPKVITQTVEVPVPTPVPVPDKTIDTGRNAALPFSCSVDEKKCVIRGFKVDGRVPNETEQNDLRSIAGVINQFADGGSIDFVGHTDSTGSAAYNQKLSVARAQNVARLLREYGLKNTISYGTITGQGESNPMDTNDTEQGRYNNRRVELFFQNVDFQNVKFINQ